MKYKIEFYRSGLLFKRYRWRLKSVNGEIIDASTQSFFSKQGAKRNLELTERALRSLKLSGQINKAYLNG